MAEKIADERIWQKEKQAESPTGEWTGEWTGECEGQFWERARKLAASLTLEGMLNEEPVGLLRMAPETGRIYLAHIQPEDRRRGLGVQLLGQAVRYARERGVETLSAVPPAGGAGEAYLRDCGFAPCGEAAEGGTLWEKSIGFDPDI